MENISKSKRERIIKFLDKIKEQNKDDDMIVAINEIENTLSLFLQKVCLVGQVIRL